MTDSKKGIFFALIAAFISGISIFVNKFAVTAIKDPLIFTTVKNIGVALILFFLLLKSGIIYEIKKLTKKELLLLALIGIVGGSIPFYLFFQGLSMISAVNGAIIQKTLVLWVGVLAAVFLKERMSKFAWMLVIILFGANVFVGAFKGFEYSVGEFYIFAATIFWAVETVISKKVLANVNPDLVVQARMGIGSLVLLIVSVILKPNALFGIVKLNLDNWLWIILTMLLLVGYVTTFYRGLKYTSATLATAILVLATLVTNFLSAIFITHTVNNQILVQSAVIILAILALYKLEVGSVKKMVTVK